MLTKAQIQKMMEMQAGMNAKVDPDWVNAGFAWRRAAYIEIAEFQEHLGYKWWKKTEPNLAQARMEIIDVWHFLLSQLIENFKGNIEEAAADLEATLSDSHFSRPTVTLNGVAYKPNQLDLWAKADLLVGLLSSKDDLKSILVFFSMVQDQSLGMSPEDLYKQYIGKNTLNRFRNDNGYKSGDYVKIWNGLEDNVHLEQMLEVLQADSVSFVDDVYQGLNARYQAALEAA